MIKLLVCKSIEQANKVINSIGIDNPEFRIRIINIQKIFYHDGYSEYYIYLEEYYEKNIKELTYIKISNSKFKDLAAINNFKILNINEFKQKFLKIIKEEDYQRENGAKYLDTFIEEIIIKIAENDLDEKIIKDK